MHYSGTPIDFFSEILSDFTQAKFSLQVYTLDIRLLIMKQITIY